MVFLSCFLPLTSTLAAPFHVVVDPGHGGSDAGATRGKIREADIALSVSKHLHEILQATPGFKASLTREKDQTVPLASRSQMAKKANGHLFISIHVNSNLDPRAKGAEFYFQNQLPPEEESLLLANLENQAETETLSVPEKSKQKSEVLVIQDDLARTYQIHMSRELAKALKSIWKNDHQVVHANVRQGPFHVISSVPMPALLIELGFLSNPSDAKWLSQPEIHRKLAESILVGIKSLKEKMDKFSEGGHITAHAN